MGTSLNTGVPARDIGYQMLQYVAGRVTALASGAAVAQKIGTVPAGAIITSIISRVATAITGGTPVLALGTSSTAGTQIQGTMAETAGSEQVFPASSLVMPLAADTEVWAHITGGATAGDAYIAVGFIKPVS
jgi:hypothetical protein